MSHLSFMVEQTQKRMRLLGERTQKVTRELEQALQKQEGELKAQMSGLDVAKREVEKLRRDKEHRLEDLRRLESDNSKTKKEQPE